MGRRFWTKEEDEKLKAIYTSCSNNQLSEVFGRSRISIQSHATQLGIALKGHKKKRYKDRRWTEDELKYLQEKAGTAPAYQLAVVLDRSAQAIYHKINCLGLPSWRIPKGKRERERNYSKWSWLKIKVHQRDGIQCIICGYAKAVNVHHIESVRDGGEDMLENLITLCPNCHAEAHLDLIDKKLLLSKI